MPSKYREELSARANGQLVITRDPLENCLSIYPLDEWLVVEERISQLPSTSPAVQSLQRVVVGGAVDIELDANGRVVVPPLLRGQLKLDKRVMLVGRRNRFQLWDEGAWDAQLDADLAVLKEPGALPEELRGLIL